MPPSRPWKPALVGLALVVAALAGLAPRPAGAQGGALRPLVVSFLDVGQGDSSLVQLPTGENVLVDAGDLAAGPTVVADLQARGVSSLDMVIMSHPHADHIGGMPDVLGAFPVRLVLDAGVPTSSRIYRNVLGLIGERGAALKLGRAGMTKDYGAVHLELLAPEDPLLAGTHSDPNNNSIVARWTFGRFSLLQTGDLEKDGTERLLASNAELGARVLKVPHHGSRYTSSLPFLQRVHPELAVISAGLHNDYHHPHQQALERLQQVGARILVTATSGTVTVTSSGADSFDVQSEK